MLIEQCKRLIQFKYSTSYARKYFYQKSKGGFKTFCQAIIKIRDYFQAGKDLRKPVAENGV